MKQKIYIVEDHEVVIQGVKLNLSDSDDYEFIGYATTGEKAIKELENIRPDILLLDIKLSGMQGFEIAECIQEKYCDIKIIFLSSNTDKESFEKALSLGAKGYLSKDVSKEEFLLALKKVKEGDSYFSSGIQNSVLTQMSNPKNEEEEHLIPLSEREIEVIKLFVDGFTYKEIANKLNISARTVETHKKNILNKLELKTTVDLVKYAIKQGIISI